MRDGDASAARAARTRPAAGPGASGGPPAPPAGPRGPAVLWRPGAAGRLAAADRAAGRGLARQAARELGHPRARRLLIDCLILLVPVIVLTVIVVGVAAGSDTGAAVTGLLGFLAYLVVALLYAPLLMAREGARNGQTLGQAGRSASG